MALPHKPLLSREIYFKRVIRGAVASLALVIISLLIGIGGYYYIGHLNLVDSLLNASMILGGMGPVDTLKTNAAKLFASFYALYSGVAFLTMAALLFAPVYHRFLHKFHLEIAKDEEDADKE
jgi:hypothetical protein